VLPMMGSSIALHQRFARRSLLHPSRLPSAAGLVVFSFLVVEPQDIGFLPQSGSVLGSEVGSKGRQRRCWKHSFGAWRRAGGAH
jgi:hypothetical protein